MDKRIYEYPLFISYPRTGAHWLNCVMELYFDRPRLREKRVTFLDPARDDWMWFHDHDPALEIKHEDALYLFRDPVDTIFSNIAYDLANSKLRVINILANITPLTVSEKIILSHCKRYRRHLEKWLTGPNKARTYIIYDKIKVVPESEFKKICDHFGTKINPDRLHQALERASRGNIVKRAGVLGGFPGMRKDMLKEQYKILRSDFRQKWQDRINREVVTKNLESFFG